MADLSMLASVTTGQNITAAHHNGQNTAIQNVNTEATAGTFSATYDARGNLTSLSEGGNTVTVSIGAWGMVTAMTQSLPAQTLTLSRSAATGTLTGITVS